MSKDKDHFRPLAEKYLSHNATEQEREELLAWMQDNNELTIILYDDIEMADKDMPESKKRNVYNNIIRAEKHLEKSKKRLMIRLNRVLSIACIVLILIVCTLIYKQATATLPDSDKVEVKTAATDHSELSLPDGTKVKLNSQSVLSYQLDNNSKQRIVNLEGEGYFEVAADKKYPFKIITNGMELLCLGTTFDIKNYDEDNSAKVTLREGSVKVTSGTQEILMTPGTSVTYNKNTGKLTQNNAQKESPIGWINGNIYYCNESLENIANDLSRKYGVRIVISSPEICKTTFSGYLGKTSLENILDVLSTASGISYEFINDSTVHIYEYHS